MARPETRRRVDTAVGVLFVAIALGILVEIAMRA
jgi:hypothetical protein